MNLPILEQLREDESTYITFSKTNYDLDKAMTNDTEFYFTKMVALNLPIWENPSFYIDLSSVGVTSTNPNVVIPKAIQYYMENIIRQNISLSGDNVENITEIAFYKLLNKMGLNSTQIFNSCVTFVNSVVTNNFITTETNNGWAELICQIPNNINKLLISTKVIDDISPVVSTNDTDTALYDNGNKEFLFSDSEKLVIDFENLSYDTTTIEDLSFNTLLLFYRDEAGIEKLHGINFIYPYENKVTYWDQITFTTKTNKVRNSGFQFVFNQKTCINQPSIDRVYICNEEAMWWNGFEKTLTGLNSFLETVYPNTGIDSINNINLLGELEVNDIINLSWEIRMLNTSSVTSEIISAFGSKDIINNVLQQISENKKFQFQKNSAFSTDISKVTNIQYDSVNHILLIEFIDNYNVKTLTFANVNTNIIVSSINIKPLSNV